MISYFAASVGPIVTGTLNENFESGLEEQLVAKLSMPPTFR